MYVFGTGYYLVGFSGLLTYPVTCFIFLPFFHNLNLTSAYEVSTCTYNVYTDIPNKRISCSFYNALWLISILLVRINTIIIEVQRPEEEDWPTIWFPLQRRLEDFFNVLLQAQCRPFLRSFKIIDRPRLSHNSIRVTTAGRCYWKRNEILKVFFPCMFVLYMFFCLCFCISVFGITV